MSSRANTRLREGSREPVKQRCMDLAKLSKARGNLTAYLNSRSDLSRSSYLDLVEGVAKTWNTAFGVLVALGYDNAEISQMLEEVASADEVSNAAAVPTAATLDIPSTAPSVSNTVKTTAELLTIISARKATVGRSLVCASLVTLIVLVCMHFLGPTRAGRWAQFHAVQILEWHAPIETNRLPIVIDISHLPGEQTSPTPRQDLLALVRAVAAQRPAGIAVDIDFSPQKDEFGREFTNPEDFRFFLEACRMIADGASSGPSGRSDVPVFLCVGRTWNKSPDHWLANVKYNGMAVAPNVNSADVRLAPRWFICDSYGDHQCLRSVGEALAEAYVSAHESKLPAPAPWARWAMATLPSNPFSHDKDLVCGEVNRDAEGVSGTSLTNYRALGAYTDELFAWKEMNADDITSQAEKMPIEGKMVLIGDMSERDMFPVRGAGIREPGVLLHACAAYTFALAPRYELNLLGRTVLDVLFSIMLWVTFRLIHSLKAKMAIESMRWRLLFHVLAYGAILCGILLIGWSMALCGLIWLDPLAIWCALVLCEGGQHLLNNCRSRLSADTAYEV